MHIIERTGPVRFGRRHFKSWFRSAAIVVVWSLISAEASAERKILQNDSFTGTATFTHLAAFDEQETAAATFTPDAGDYPLRIEKVQVLVLALFPGTIAFVSAAVWEDVGTVIPGPEIYNSSYGFQVESSDTAMNELSLSCENIVINEGKVRLGLRWEYIADLIGLVFDAEGPVPATNSIYSTAEGGWVFTEDLDLTGDWIMRLEIETNIGGEELFADDFERGDQSCW